MTWVVTGGCGYIGAHVVRRLSVVRRPVVVVDDLSTGRLSRIPDSVRLVRVSVHDQEAMTDLLAHCGAEGVIHLAGLRTVTRPARDHWRQNEEGVSALLAAMRNAKVRRLVHTSTAAVYGQTSGIPVPERAATRPLSAYGEAKLAAERLIRCAADSWLAALILRPFNVIGAAGYTDHGTGNLVPAAFAAASGGPPLVVAGCGIRDYVHVDDIARAIVQGARLLDDPGLPPVLNLGTGTGRSVTEVIKAITDVTGRAVPLRPGARRDGDPSAVVADVRLARECLGWTATTGFHESLESGWIAWQRRSDGSPESPTPS